MSVHRSVASVGWSVGSAFFFGILKATNAVYTALFLYSRGPGDGEKNEQNRAFPHVQIFVHSISML